MHSSHHHGHAGPDHHVHDHGGAPRANAARESASLGSPATHGHAHDHAHAGHARTGAAHATAVAPAFSALRLSLARRLGIAAAASALIWAGVFWAMPS